MEKFTMVGDVALHYTDSGCGETPVLLLHGYLESLDVWDDFATMLRKRGFRVITLDLPGHGISEVVSETHTMEFLADTVVGLLDKIGVDKFCVVGHSMGGYVALALAKKYPTKLLSLVLFHSTPNADSPEKIEDRKREIEIVRQGKKEMLSRIAPEKRFAKNNRKKFADVIDGLELQVMLTEEEGIIAILKGMAQRENMNEMLHNLKVPQCFIFGRNDDYIPVEVAEEAAKNNPQAEVHWLEKSGHIGFVEEPEESLKIIEEFANAHKS